jgi:hypothetical protein
VKSNIYICRLLFTKVRHIHVLCKDYTHAVTEREGEKVSMVKQVKKMKAT